MRMSHLWTSGKRFEIETSFFSFFSLNCANLQPTSVVEVWHKSDYKFQDGEQNGSREHYNWLQLNHVWHIAFRCMRASTLAFLVKLTNASDRHLNFLSIHIRSIQTSVTRNISKFLRIVDIQRDGQNNKRSRSTLAAIQYKIQLKSVSWCIVRISYRWAADFDNPLLDILN